MQPLPRGPLLVQRQRRTVQHLRRQHRLQGRVDSLARQRLLAQPATVSADAQASCDGRAPCFAPTGLVRHTPTLLGSCTDTPRRSQMCRQQRCMCLLCRCFNPKACLGGAAAAAALNATASSNQTAARRLLSTIADEEAYKTAQCADAYQGNACGNCKQGWGRTRPFHCR